MGKDGGSASKKRKTAPTEGSSRKRKSNSGNQQLLPSYYQEYCELPFTLSTILVDEFDCIANCNSPRSLHVLPARVTVKQVLQHYQRKRGGSNSSSSKENQNKENNNSEQQQQQQQHNERIRRFCESLALLFDDALPVCLLYREERPQYESLQQDANLKLKRPCEIYGSTFLLRLLQRLPILLKAEPRKEMDELGPLISDLVVLLQKNKQACFGKDSYREPKHDELMAWEKEAICQQESGSSSKTIR
eukprot:CAMPEP_0116126346 /NCGR_PEP_ID=MMETSP0329-20121206/6286_1 /TAXON_ID=697910 /ORGANISM="Pseudo-nitzschia arenysensis, Strain B593" /LENGTH=246 /DNA_ID=CAMNT_0003620429 /DNA_START=148 /DNA_END=888 /DNA_ORIENTATION=+